MKTVCIKGAQHNCEAAKTKIEELVKLSVKWKVNGQSKVCALDVLMVQVLTCLYMLVYI